MEVLRLVVRQEVRITFVVTPIFAVAVRIPKVVCADVLRVVRINIR